MLKWSQNQKDDSKTEKFEIRANTRILVNSSASWEQLKILTPWIFYLFSDVQPVRKCLWEISSSQECPLCPLVPTRYTILKLFSNWKYMKNFITSNIIFYTQKTNTLAENNYHCCPFCLPHLSSGERLVENNKVIQLQDYFIIDLFSKTKIRL